MDEALRRRIRQGVWHFLVASAAKITHSNVGKRTSWCLVWMVATPCIASRLRPRKGLGLRGQVGCWRCVAMLPKLACGGANLQTALRFGPAALKCERPYSHQQSHSGRTDHLVLPSWSERLAYSRQRQRYLIVSLGVRIVGGAGSAPLRVHLVYGIRHCALCGA